MKTQLLWVPTPNISAPVCTWDSEEEMLAALERELGGEWRLAYGDDYSRSTLQWRCRDDAGTSWWADFEQHAWRYVW